ncbi:Copper amine oxidase N-terminal domain-containing protein [Paenibacillus sp. cl141a]|uniref:stalk domain-containing protein n=1 Tax=Paenibacillus sp. cl141a TaxID=1761877 RepID=UPI0008CC31C6|nr:stalk domain-containing protein [Paenibacillus sp. cl141a]SEM15887.1 Copper amine oxidase N-terminal domain-containing protein [Paenibacillus sp. cl141a]
MKKKWIGCTLALLLVSGSVVSAHPGRTDANGGHTCRTNCERWGLSYGEYHYHNGGGSSSGSKSPSSAPKSKSSQKSTAKPAAPKPAAPAYAKSGLKVYVNGSVVKFDSEPLVYNNINLVPLREIAEGMGAKVVWNRDAASIGVQRGNHKITLTIGSKTVYYNGKSETVSVAPKVMDGVTYVPIQVFARGLGAGVNYTEHDKILRISFKE